MAGRARGPVRCSARLSNGGGAAAAETEAANEAQRARARSAEAAAAAAGRRARAAERAQEVEDSPRVLRDKCRRLARALRNAKHLVVNTFVYSLKLLLLLVFFNSVMFLAKGSVELVVCHFARTLSL